MLCSSNPRDHLPSWFSLFATHCSPSSTPLFLHMFSLVTNTFLTSRYLPQTGLDTPLSYILLIKQYYHHMLAYHLPYLIVNSSRAEAVSLIITVINLFFGDCWYGESMLNVLRQNFPGSFQSWPTSGFISTYFLQTRVWKWVFQNPWETETGCIQLSNTWALSRPLMTWKATNYSRNPIMR